jgi:tetratricopeptide (TPR) repeat protein
MQGPTVAAAQSPPPVSRVETEVRRARALMEQRQFAPALALAQTLLAEVPENRDVLYLIAAGERYLGRIPEALRTLERLEALHPQYARLFQERGHCYRSLGNTAAAIAAYQRAVALNEALPASWKALQELLRAAGRNAEAEHARALAEYLGRLPPAIISASSLFAEGDVLGAEQIARQFLQTHPDHIEGMRLLGRIGMKLDVLDDAEFLLESVLVFAPDYHAARYDYAEVLCQRHKYAQALKEAERLRQWEPKNRNFRILYANACVGLGDHERALAMYRELLGDAPQNPQELYLSIAHALKTLGRQPEAIAAYRAAAAAQPSFGDAYWSLANLKTYHFTEEELTRMRAAEGRAGVSLIDRYHLCFALGKALEDRAAHAESFQYYERGNELKKTETRYKPGLFERDVRLQISACTREFFSARQGVGCARPDPIFIVGLPRAGSTLIEQILASHSRVEGTMELADIPRLVQHLNGRHHLDAPPRYPAVLPELTAEQLRRYGEKFLGDTQVYRTDKPYFIDKMPNNFRHIGLIHLILPNAKIIDARREPMACCFSNFKQLFASGQEFTYSLEDIGRYYRAYVELMAHWDAVLPGTVLRVQHEQLVEDFEPSVRRILDFIGLEFEPACLEFYKTERSVRTASSEQVRQPIYREGLEQWRNFEAWLGPLKVALGDLAGS